MATITELLAETKTITARITRQEEAILRYLVRPAQMRDPMENDGGVVEFVRKTRQSVDDLEKRLINIRLAIATANIQNSVTVNGVTKTIAEWLQWRREVAPIRQRQLTSIANAINSVRKQGKKVGTDGTTTEAVDFVVALNEKDLAAEIEEMETILGELDGKLSLANATLNVQV